MLICQTTDTRLQGDDRDVFRDNQADRKGSLTNTDTRGTLSIPYSWEREKLPRKEELTTGRQGCGKRVTPRYGSRHENWVSQLLGSVHLDGNPANRATGQPSPVP